MAQGFWGLLIPHGLEGGAITHIASAQAEEDDVDMTGTGEGWKEAYTQWWFDFLNEKGGKGVSKDTWQMVRVVVSYRSIVSPRACPPWRRRACGCDTDWLLTGTRLCQFLEFVRTIDARFETYDAEGVCPISVVDWIETDADADAIAATTLSCMAINAGRLRRLCERTTSLGRGLTALVGSVRVASAISSPLYIINVATETLYR